MSLKSAPKSFTSCIKHKVKVAFFQETHFRSDTIPTIRNKHFSVWYHSTFHDSKYRGVSIALHKSISFQLHTQRTEPEVKFLLLKWAIKSKTYTLVNVYLPNQNKFSRISGFMTDLQCFAEGILVVGAISILPLTQILTLRH